MTDKGLYWFKCDRCNKSMMSYIFGRREYRDGDYYFVPLEGDEFRTYQRNSNDFDTGSYFKPITHIKRLCMACSKGSDLMSYQDDTNPFIFKEI